MQNTQIATSQNATEQVLAFAEKVFRRADGPDTLVPRDYVPDWLDRPARWRLYPEMPRIPLASPALLQKTFSRLTALNETASQCQVPTLEQLSLALYMVLGPLKRKLDINWNSEIPATAFNRQEYTRGTASGGGLYPAQLYLVPGTGRAPGPGVYHYSNAEHALIPIRHGEWAQATASAVAPGVSRTVYPYYLIVAMDFWMNCFKYHNFGYHVCCEDTGTILAALHLSLDALGIAHRNLLAFHDAAANEVIGADGRTESVFAVVGIGSALNEPEGTRRLAACPVPKALQRSRVVKIPDLFADVHQATLLGYEDARLLTTAAEQAKLRTADSLNRRPLDEAIRASLPGVLSARKSAWNSMRGPGEITLERLLDLLDYVWRHGHAANPSRERLASGAFEIRLRVNRVAGLAQGLYRWAPDEAGSGRLVPQEGEYLALWQATYSMANYNIDEVSCTLFLTGDLKAVAEQYGARGYRILNAYVGMTAQLTYVAAAALQMDCGVVLGVRAQTVKQALALEPDRNVFLAVYLSQAQKRVEMFSFNLLQDVTPCKPQL